MTPALRYYNHNPIALPDHGGSQNHKTASTVLNGEMSSMDASRTTTETRDDASISISNASEMESEWVEQDQPGVYITIRQLADGTRELRRVRFRYYIPILQKYSLEHKETIFLFSSLISFGSYLTQPRKIWRDACKELVGAEQRENTS